MSDINALAGLLRSGALAHTRLADSSGVLLHADTLQVLTLNETGMFLVDRLREGTETIDGLVDALVSHFTVNEKTARRDVSAFLDELRRLLQHESTA
ncbi:MAG: PqqD family protein [Acidobacteria bacterium]|nr:PqqD family protein [Acidobacteriota bacterium]